MLFLTFLVLTLRASQSFDCCHCGVVKPGLLARIGERRGPSMRFTVPLASPG